MNELSNNITAQGVTETYIEELPDGCPPDDAVDTDDRLVLRLVPSDNVQIEDFHSHAKLGKSKPKDICGCRWASCSVFNSPDAQHSPNAMVKLPRVRNKALKFVAELALNPSSGKLKDAPTGGHVDLWMYDSFDPIKAVVDVREIER